MTPNDATEVVPYLTSAATIVAIQKWLKTQDVYQKFVAAFPGADKWAHWLIAGLSSLIAAIGIHVTWNWDADKGGTIILGIPALLVLLHGLADWFKVYILQHTVYEATHQSSLATLVQKAISDAVKGNGTATVVTPVIKEPPNVP